MNSFEKNTRQVARHSFLATMFDSLNGKTGKKDLKAFAKDDKRLAQLQPVSLHRPRWIRGDQWQVHALTGQTVWCRRAGDEDAADAGDECEAYAGAGDELIELPVADARLLVQNAQTSGEGHKRELDPDIQLIRNV